MLNELVKKWREEFEGTKDHEMVDWTLNYCADELEAALAKAWPWRSVQDELPEKGRECLLYHGGIIASGRLSGRTWSVDGIIEAHVGSKAAPTHWMYADEAPRPKGGEDAP